jgi:hypothetical protein
MALPSNIRQSVRNQATKLLVTGNRFARFDQIRQRHFWSNYLFQSDENGYIASGDYKLFTTPSGQTGQGYKTPITDRETNWKSANRVPDNQNFEILELGVSLLPVFAFDAAGFENDNFQQLNPQSSNTVLQNTLLSIQYLTNEISLGLCQDFAQSAGPMMGSYFPANLVDDGGTNVRSNYTTNGFAAPGLRRRFKIPILLQHGETFTFNLKVPRSFFVGEPTEQDEPIFYIMRMDFWATESFVERS